MPRRACLIGGARSPDVFTVMALLTVLGTAWIAFLVGLSMSLSAFLAGLLLSGPEFRHEIQAETEPTRIAPSSSSAAPA